MESVSDYQNSDHATTRGGCCGRFRAEVALGPFELVEANGQMIDVQRSFAAKPFWVVVLIKLVLTGVSVDAMVRDIILYNASTRYFYFAYLTHWGLLCAIIFMLLSFANTLMPYPEQPGRGLSASVFVKLAWAFFPLAATIEAVVVALYWTLDNDPNAVISYFGYMQHGGVFVLLLLEGLVVDRVPIRIHHMRYPLILSTAYGIWSAVHCLLTDIGNPNVDGGDDAIYPALNWEERPLSSLVTVLIAIFVLTPLFFMVFYVLSLPMRRSVNYDTIGDDTSSTTSTISTRTSLCNMSRFRPKAKKNPALQDV